MKKKIAFSLLAAGALLVVGTQVWANQQTDEQHTAAPMPARPVDNYQVIRVDGTILFVKSGKTMIRGDVFAETEKIEFKSKESRAAVISKLAGRKILTPSTSGKPELLPAMNNVASRSGAMVNAIDMRNHFSGNYLLLGKSEMQISKESFPMDDTRFFFIRYEYQGETINKKLNATDDKLVMDTDELYKIDGRPIDRTTVRAMTLYYRDGSKNTLIAEFTPVAPVEDVLKEEVGIILEQTKATTADEKVEEVMAYLTEFYGKPEKEALKTWVSGNFKL
jgi:hypothetical protein